MEFDLKALAPLDRYKLLTGLIVPRPIGFISSLSSDGRRNAAPFSFFNMFGASPPVVVLGISPRGGAHKDSFRNIVDTGEFVVNIATAALAGKMNETSADFEPEVDEFEACALTAAPSKLISAPRIHESPANLECRLLQTVPLDGKGALIVGEMVYAHVRDEIVDGFKVDQTKLDAIGRMGGPLYAYTRDLFAKERPVLASKETAA